MLTTGFEPAVPASELPQADATGIGCISKYRVVLLFVLGETKCNFNARKFRDAKIESMWRVTDESVHSL